MTKVDHIQAYEDARCELWEELKLDGISPTEEQISIILQWHGWWAIHDKSVKDECRVLKTTIGELKDEVSSLTAFLTDILKEFKTVTDELKQYNKTYRTKHLNGNKIWQNLIAESKDIDADQPENKLNLIGAILEQKKRKLDKARLFK
jgi:hypothetical protein